MSVHPAQNDNRTGAADQCNSAVQPSSIEIDVSERQSFW